MSGLERDGLCRSVWIFVTISAFSFMYGMFQNYCIFARSKLQRYGTEKNNNKESGNRKPEAAQEKRSLWMPEREDSLQRRFDF